VLTIEEIDAVRPLAELQRQTQGNERLTMVQTDFGYPAIESMRILTGGQQVEYLGIDTKKPPLNPLSTFHHIVRQHIFLRGRHDGLPRIRSFFIRRKARDVGAVIGDKSITDAGSSSQLCSKFHSWKVVAMQVESQ
jgi:hypothetical protein